MAKKKKQTTERKKLDTELLDLWSLCVRARDKTCRYWNTDENLSAHHIIEKGYRWGRYALENGLTLSFKVHSLQKHRPEQFRDMIIEIIGEDEFTRLKEKYMYQPPCKRTLTELREIKTELRKELKKWNT